ncbi:MAG TPA: TonB-dependent receptor [Acetobacteraceae bacterium]|nr:TonB-dependent receptor [Acetobacteraceae bacterium]
MRLTAAFPPSRGLALAALLASPTATLAQPAAILPTLEVTGERAGSLTVPSVEEQRRALERTPAAVRLVPSEAFGNRRAFNLRDVLADTPGVFVQTRYGQELRLSVRGSGIGRGFHLRGVELLEDGIPWNLADGSGDFYQIDPLAVRAVEVYPGGNALRFGASILGGAINFVSPTAYTAEAPNILRAEGGSFGTWRLSGQVSRAFGPWDALLNATAFHSDGYREHSRSQYEQFNANVGYRIAPNVETRFYAGAFIVRQLVPGTLSLYDALNNPRNAAPAAVLGNQARNVWAERFANRTTAEFGYGRFDVDTWITHKSLYHPIFQVFDQDGLTWGVAPRFTTGFDVAGLRSDLVVGARYFAGTNEALQYINVRGSRGQQTLNARQDARNYEAFAEGRLWVLPQWALVAGAKMFRSERDYEDKGGGLSASRGAVSLGRTYDGFVPRFGVLWQPRPEVQAYANITRSTDVPDFSDLAQPQLGGVTSFVPLEAQRAWTVEIGTRGQFGRYGWDLTLFRSNIRGQLLQFTQAPNLAPATTFNAGLTVNQGVEFAGRIELARNLTSAEAGDRLSLRQVWTFNDFRFRGDRQYGDNRIAGLPPHVLRTTLTYSRPEGLFITPILDWVPQGAWADYANTLRANAYLTLGLEAGLTIAPGVTVFLDARNLSNKRYISDLSTITDARTVASTAVFYPGDGRSLYVGARAAF